MKEFLKKLGVWMIINILAILIVLPVYTVITIIIYITWIIASIFKLFGYKFDDHGFVCNLTIDTLLNANKFYYKIEQNVYSGIRYYNLNVAYVHLSYLLLGLTKSRVVKLCDKYSKEGIIVEDKDA